MLRKPKVLFLLHLPPPVHGSSVVGLAIMQSQVINGQLEGRFVNLLASKSVADTGNFTAAKVVGFIRTWFRVLGCLISFRPSLCYLAVTATGAAMYKDLLLVILLKIFRVRIVYHMHNKGVSRSQSGGINHLAYKLLFSNVKVILLSGLLYEDIKKYVAREDVYICPNGIEDPLPQAASITHRLHNSSAPVRILFLSNLIESKGVFVLLQALATLHRKGVPFMADFIGGEGDVSEGVFTQRVNDLGLTGLATYHGKKYGKEKNAAFTAADVFAFPTFYPIECFPLVLLEAMSYSLPVISTFEGGIPDIVREGITGFLVPQKNIEELADRLERLHLDQALRQRMGEAARKDFTEKFLIRKFEDDMLAILLNVTAGT